jgi:hypothetical protein
MSKVGGYLQPATPEENYQLCRVPRIEGLIGHDRMQKKMSNVPHQLTCLVKYSEFTQLISRYSTAATVLLVQHQLQCCLLELHYTVKDTP